MIKYIKNIICSPLKTSKYQVTKLGSNGCSWNVVLDELGSDSVIISGGVGQDVSFELAISKITGANVYLFDPSPTGIQTIDSLSDNLTAGKLKFEQKALSNKDGIFYLSPPDIKDEGSWRMSTSSQEDDSTAVQSIRLSSFCSEKLIQKIDLLKIDIEGAEYEVLDDILSNQINVKQICVEFHCNAQIKIDKTYFDIVIYLLKLWRCGYRIAYLTKSDFTLVKNIPRGGMGW